MFIGHYAPALVAATLRRKPDRGLTLGPLFIAAQLVDIAFFGFALIGVEHYAIQPWFTTMNPFDLYDVRWTHSLLGTLGWAAAFALVVRAIGGSQRAGWIGAGVVASHWLLDLLSHSPDLTLAGGVTRYGLGLWNHPYIEMPLELGITAAALTCYANRTRAVDWRGKAALGLLAVALAGFQLVDWLRPQPHEGIDPAPAATSLTALAVYLILTVFAWWTASSRQVIQS